MAAESKKNQPGSLDTDRAKMKRMLLIAGGVAVVIILVTVIASLSVGSAIKMSDGSDGSPDDPKLVEVSNGVKIREIKEGGGEACPPGAIVTVKYTGWLTNGNVFDTSANHGGSVQLDLAGSVIAGWKHGVPGMKVGGIRKIVVAPGQGYGDQGAPPKIPPGSTLVFEVELLDYSAPRRRSPPPADLTKLSDGTLPGAEDPGLTPIGSMGLKYRDIKVGDGPEVPAGAKVLVDYIGWRLDGKMFDSTWKPGRKPFTALLKMNPNTGEGVIPGWQQGVPGMKVGGIRKLVIPPELAYGSTGYGNDIPPNSTLVFEIEVLGIQ